MNTQPLYTVADEFGIQQGTYDTWQAAARRADYLQRTTLRLHTVEPFSV